MEPINIKFPDVKYVPKAKLKPIPEPIDFEAMPDHSPKLDPTMRLKKLVSRELVAVLRHKAVAAGLPMSDDGFVELSALLAHNSKLKKANLEMVQQIVAENDKKRLELKHSPDGHWYLRAVQGHSIPLDEDKMMRLVGDAAELHGVTVVHGTTEEAWQFIRKTGLNKMARNHIHFARGYPGDQEVISGMRTTCQIFVELDVPLALANGIKIMESANGVILSSGFNGVISPVYFKHVYRRDPATGQRVRIFGNDNLGALMAEFGFRHLFVLDFEANCLEGQQIDPQEILEFPVVVVDAMANLVLPDKTFHHYIRPDVHPVSAFCTELTGITPDVVAQKGVPLAEALTRFHQWVAANGFDLEQCCFVTCGMWDLKTCLRNEAAFRKLELDPFFKRFVNLKEVFALKCGFHQKKFGMLDMLEELDLEPHGRHHSGIDDCHNIARVVVWLGQNHKLITREFVRNVA